MEKPGESFQMKSPPKNGNLRVHMKSHHTRGSYQAPATSQGWSSSGGCQWAIRQTGKLRAADAGHSGQGAMTPTAPHSQLEASKAHWRTGCVHRRAPCTQDSSEEEDCGFPVACPRGHESLRGHGAWKGRPSGQNGRPFSVLKTNNPTEYILIHFKDLPGFIQPLVNGTASHRADRKEFQRAVQNTRILWAEEGRKRKFLA